MKTKKKAKIKKYSILDLKPTQFAVGMLEVDEKIAALKSLTEKQFKKSIQETVVPVVRSPNGQLYVVDRHHFLSVCYHLDIDEVSVEIVKDFKGSKLTYRQFWTWMQKQRNCFLYCQFGSGPHQEFYLPRDVRGLADDPYRSLAWFVRKAGGFENSDKNFAEFLWANFFRGKKLLNHQGIAGFENALVKAVHLAQSPAAKHLPGFGKLKIDEQNLLEKKARKKVKKYRKRFIERAVVASAK